MNALYYRLNVLYVEVPETFLPQPQSLAS